MWMVRKNKLLKHFSNFQIALTLENQNFFPQTTVSTQGIPPACKEALTYSIKLIPLKESKAGANNTETILCGNSTCDAYVDEDTHRIVLTVLKNDIQSMQGSVYVPAVGESES